MKPIRKILNQYRAKGILDPKEIAGLVECSPRKVNYVLEGKANFKDTEIREIAQYYSEMGYNELSYLFMSTRYAITLRGEGKVNGTVSDELKDLLHELDEVLENIDNRRLDEALRDCDQMESVIQRFRSEIKAMRQP